MRKFTLILLSLVFLGFSFNDAVAQPDTVNIIVCGQDGTVDGQVIAALRDAGYNVTADNAAGSQLDSAKAAVLNTYDLVIIGRQGNSGNFGADYIPFWQQVTAPVLCQMNFGFRAARLKWFEAAPQSTSVDSFMIVQDRTHPIFTNTFVNENDSTCQLGMTERGWHNIASDSAGNGKILATAPGDGNICIAEWEPGIEMWPGRGIHAGKRMIFPLPDRVSDGKPLTDYGLQFYVDICEYLVYGTVEEKVNPVDVSIDSDEVTAYVQPGTTVGVLSTEDSPFTITSYNLVPGDGDSENSSFYIDNDVLKTAAILDGKSKQVSVRVRATDSLFYGFETALTINVTPFVAYPDTVNILLCGQDGTVDGQVIAALRDAGYNVTADNAAGSQLDSAKAAVLNTYDLVIIGRQGNSGNFGADYIPFWQQVTAPVLCQMNYGFRAARLKWFEAAPQSTSVDSFMIVQDRIHPIFTNTFVNENDSTSQLGMTERGWHNIASDSAGNGKILATAPGDGKICIAEWEPGTEMWPGRGIHAGKRMIFPLPDGVSDGKPLTDNGLQFYVDICEYMVYGVVQDKVSPRNLTISRDEIMAELPVGTIVGVLKADDPQNNIASFELVNGSGVTNNDSLYIDGDTLKTAVVLHVEEIQSLSIRIRVTDSLNFSTEEIINIKVIEFSDKPTDIMFSSTYILENEPIGITIGYLSAENAWGEIVSYALVAGEGDTDNVSFTIEGNMLKAAAMYNFEAKSTYSIRIRVTNDADNTYDKVFTITIVDVDDGPTSITLSNLEFHELNEIGDVVAILSAEDPNDDVTYFELVDGIGSDNNDYFYIDGDSLKAAVVLDFEAKVKLSIRIKVKDADGNSYLNIFTITLLNVDEAPTDIMLSGTEIMENNNISDVIGRFNAVDPEGDIASYALVSGEGDTDNANFTIDGDTLKAAVVFDLETQTSHDIRIQVMDEASNTYEKAFTLSILVGMKNSMVNDMVIYPNPVDDKLYISNILNAENSGRIISITGTTVKVFENFEGMLDVSDLESGIYIIAIETGNKHYINRFSKL